MTEENMNRLANIKTTDKGHSIPLLNKRLNSIEKYVQSYKTSDKSS